MCVFAPGLSHWFEVGRAQFEKGDVMHHCDPVSQHLNKELLTVVGLFDCVTSTQPHPCSHQTGD